MASRRKKPRSPLLVLAEGSVDFSLASVSEIGAALELLDDLQRLRLVGHQDVRGLGLLEGEAGLALHRLVGGLELLVGDALVDRLLDHAVAQHAVMGAGELGLDLGILGQVLLVGLGQQQLAADHLLEQRVEDRLQRHLAILLGQRGVGRLDVALLDLGAVDDRHHRIGGLGARRHGEGEHGQGRGGESKSAHQGKLRGSVEDAGA